MEGSPCSDHLPPPDEKIIRKNLAFPHSVAAPPFEACPPFPCAIFLGAYDRQEGSNERNHPHNHPPDQKEGGARSPVAARHGDDRRHKNEAAAAAGERDPSAATGPCRWMSSKMRFMSKMMELERTVSARRQDTMRVCSDCNTTKTPLWRSGPRGPKSLCNACGIRQRKARRAMAALAAVVPASTVGREKPKAAESARSASPFQKSFEFPAAGQPRGEELDLDGLAAGPGGGSPAAFRRRMLPRGEEEEEAAALLLMALSCGPVHAQHV